MRRLVLSVVMTLLAALTAAPACAAADLDYTQTGELRIAWHGDAARGCALAGVCDVQGTLSAQSTPGNFASISAGSFSFPSKPSGSPSGGPGQPLDFLTVNLDTVAVRVRRGGATCADPLELIGRGFTVKRGSGGRFSLELGSAGLSSGRCTGLAAPDFEALAVPGRLTGSLARGATLKLSGVSSASAGPYAVTVTSTIALHLRSARDDSIVTTTTGGPPPRAPIGRRPSRRVLELTLGYRIDPAVGTLALDFAGEAAPACAVLDACGARGTLRYPLAAAGRPLDLLATGPAPRHASVRAALTALRRGRLHVSDATGNIPSAGKASLSSRTERPGAPPCVDSTALEQPGLDVEPGRRALALTLYGAETIDGRCPGPLALDAWPTGVLARNSLPLTGARTLRATLGATGRFAAPGWTGTRMVSLPLVLHRTTARVRIVRVEL